MQWIKKNIVMFGGDPDQITLFSGCIEYCGYYLILGLDRICWISQCGIPPVVSSLQGSFYPGNSSVSLSSQPLGIDHKKGSKVESVDPKLKCPVAREGLDLDRDTVKVSNIFISW